MCAACWSVSAQQTDLWRSILGPRTAEIKEAAEAGDAQAQFQLGAAFYSKFSWTNAVIWYRKAAQQGHADGQNALGGMLLNGISGVKQNPEEGIRWLTLAANQNQVNAQLSLARVYENGTYLKRDYVESLKWLTLAEKKSSIVARVHADALVLKMTQEEITEAGKRVAAFVPAAPVKVLPVLKLQGMMGSGDKATALINGKSLRSGEEVGIKVDEDILKVKCLKVENRSVTIMVQGESKARVLRLD